MFIHSMKFVYFPDPFANCCSVRNTSLRMVISSTSRPALPRARLEITGLYDGPVGDGCWWVGTVINRTVGCLLHSSGKPYAQGANTALRRPSRAKKANALAMRRPTTYPIQMQANEQSFCASIDVMYCILPDTCYSCGPSYRWTFRI